MTVNKIFRGRNWGQSEYLRSHPANPSLPHSKGIHRQASIDNDEQVLQSELPVLVDYWAEWCAPCKAMAPVLDEIAEEYRGRLRVVKVNVEQEPQIVRQYGVRSQPTLMLFKHGSVEAQKVGALSKSQLRAFIELNLD